MAKTLTANVQMSVTGSHVNALDLGNVSFPFADTLNIAFTSGTGAGQADMVFTDTRTLSASGTEDLDLAGVLADAFGATMTFAKIKSVFFKASTGNTNDVQITRPASNGVPWLMAAGDGIALKPGFGFLWAGSGTGVTVTATTGDLITVTNSAGTTGVTYDVVVVGTSA